MVEQQRSSGTPGSAGPVARGEDSHVIALPSLLTIGIPTFNRAPKLGRLLEWLENELAASGLIDTVLILVANNASADNTEEILRLASSRRLRLTYVTHPQNLGFDRNVFSLYQNVTTPYLWFLGDDDLPLPGTISLVLGLIASHSPDVLLGPFIQPPGSWRAETEYPEPFRIIRDAPGAIDCIDLHWKLASYVIRAFPLDADQLREIEQHFGPLWMFMALTFTVLQASRALQLIALSKPIATSDDDWHIVAFSPAAILNNRKVFEHTFVRRWLPGLIQQRRSSSYRKAIEFLWQGQLEEQIVPADPAEWDKISGSLDWRWQEFLYRPGLALQLLLVKARAGYFLRRGLLAKMRRAQRGIWLYCSKAGWLSEVRRIRRSLQTQKRQKQLSRLAGARKQLPEHRIDS